MFHLYYLFALDAAHGFFSLRVPVPADKPEFTSLTDAVHAVNWQEREVQDLFGLKLLGHPNPRRCALHDDWPDVYPLRKDFDLRTVLPPFAGIRHRFREVEGEGVFHVPVGPVHAGIIEPGHFLFSVAGEPVLYLQLRMFYVHKGTEKLFENLPAEHGVRLAESISGDSAFAHATAFCHAVERAAGGRGAAAGPRPAHALPRAGAPLQPRRRHRRHLHRRGVHHRQHARDAAPGTGAARERGAHGQPPPARHGLPRRRALRFRRRRKSRPWRSCCAGSNPSSTRSSISSASPPAPGTVWKPRAFSSPRWRAISASSGSSGAPPGSTATCAAIFRTRSTTRCSSPSPCFTEGDVQRRLAVRREEVCQSMGILDR